MRPHRDLPVLSDAALRLLREDQPNSNEISRAYRRVARPPRHRPHRLLMSRWVIAGLVMGLGVAFGSEAIVQRLHPTTPSSPSGGARIVAPKARKAAPVSAPRPSQQSDPEAPALEPPAAVPQFEPLSPPTSAVSAKPPRIEVDAHTPADRAAWAKAAEGLRNNDLSETQSALATLEGTGSDADREAARLIRAQLMLHQGDASSARALLQDLAEHAQSPAVRNKARSLLAAPSNSPLNVAPSGT
ncbi:MAG TPA: hypothetical protein VER96_08535 [Polyangiaceae bacterium]|nr:hypothetical protein [Polyangiaceae bacterium]